MRKTIGKTISTEKLSINNLLIGMFVSRLDIPWEQTDYSMQGFYLETREDIEKVQSYCQYVYIDIVRTHERSTTAYQYLTDKKDKPKSVRKFKEKREWQVQCNHQYTVQPSANKEIEEASALMSYSYQVVKDMVLSNDSLSEKQINVIGDVSKKITETVIKNPDVMLWLTKVHNDNKEIYDHTLRASVRASLMAKHLNLSPEKLHILTQAIMLTGIGKAKLAINDWNEYDGIHLTKAFRKYVPLTFHALSHSNINPKVLTVIKYMTCRFNDIGKKKNNRELKKIPLLSQIAGIVESFELIVNPIHSKNKNSVSYAFSQLFNQRDILFDAVLVDEFIKTLGIYPVGTTVKLSSGEIAIVVEQNVKNRFCSKVAITNSADLQPLMKVPVVQLGTAKYQGIQIKSEYQDIAIDDVKMKKINRQVVKSLLGHSGYWLARYRGQI